MKIFYFTRKIYYRQHDQQQQIIQHSRTHLNRWHHYQCHHLHQSYYHWHHQHHSLPSKLRTTSNTVDQWKQAGSVKNGRNITNNDERGEILFGHTSRMFLIVEQLLLRSPNIDSSCFNRITYMVTCRTYFLLKAYTETFLNSISAKGIGRETKTYGRFIVQREEKGGELLFLDQESKWCQQFWKFKCDFIKMNLYFTIFSLEENICFW